MLDQIAHVLRFKGHHVVLAAEATTGLQCCLEVRPAAEIETRGLARALLAFAVEQARNEREQDREDSAA